MSKKKALKPAAETGEQITTEHGSPLAKGKKPKKVYM